MNKPSEPTTREARLAEQLRRNLRRRKTQLRKAGKGEDKAQAAALPNRDEES